MDADPISKKLTVSVTDARGRAVPDGGLARWLRAIAFKSGGTGHLRSRNDKDFAVRYPSVVKGLARR
mgnify:CR=1 FL=1